MWNGDNEENRAVSSGIYYYKIEISGDKEKQSIVKRMLLVK